MSGNSSKPPSAWSWFGYFQKWFLGAETWELFVKFVHCGPHCFLLEAQVKIQYYLLERMMKHSWRVLPLSPLMLILKETQCSDERVTFSNWKMGLVQIREYPHLQSLRWLHLRVSKTAVETFVALLTSIPSQFQWLLMEGEEECKRYPMWH